MIWIKNDKEIEAMRKAGRLTGETLLMLEKMIAPGITTDQLNAAAEDFITKHGARPSFKNYRGYPKAVCTSVNSVVVHGIPGNTVLCEGDIISIDVGAYLNGFHGDAARTYAVGEISDNAKKLIEVTKQSFFEGIKFAKDGNRLGDLSSAIQNYAEQYGYGVVRDLVGHGIGGALHEDPDVPNYGKAGKGIRLRKGMTIAVEPMINEGSYDVSVMPDGWTIKTVDGKLSAHYENTIVITEGEPELLTLWDESL